MIIFYFSHLRYTHMHVHTQMGGDFSLQISLEIAAVSSYLELNTRRKSKDAILAAIQILLTC